MRQIGIFLMKRSARVVGLCVLFFLMLAVSGFVQDLDRDGGPVSQLRPVLGDLMSGGGTSSGGKFKLMGTIGQHITGLSSRVRFVLSSGFWVAGVLYIPKKVKMLPEPEPIPWW